MEDERQLAEMLAREAGQLLLSYARQGVTPELLGLEEKTPGDPVTAADREAGELIVAGLARAFPGDGILSEEAVDNPERLTRGRVWIVDPIDGTKEFVKGSGDYAVSIGLAVGGEPVLGVVLAPARGDLYLGVVGEGVWKNGEPVGFSDRSLEQAVIAVSDTEHARELSAYPVAGLAPSGSIAYKLARIAAGEADATFTINPRSEWDVAAGHALLRAAGGDLTTRDGGAIHYNQPDLAGRRGLIGGRPDVVAWLAAELERVGMPEQQLFLNEGDEVWSFLADQDRAELAGHPDLHVRHAGGQIEALIALERGAGGWRVVRAEGRDFALRTLRQDLQRTYGPLPGVPDRGTPFH